MKTLISSLLVLMALSLTAYSQKQYYPELLADSVSTFEVRQNTISNIDFYFTNFGINFYNVKYSKGGLFWPRGTMNQYIFADGVWFGAKKYHSDSNELRKMVLMTYNPNTARSWTIPGRIEDGNDIKYDLKKKYRSYISTDFNTYTGEPLDSDYDYNWSHWIKNGEKKYSHGVYNNDYVYDNAMRNRNEYTNGPLFVSEEDVISTFKDTDLNYYEGGKAIRLSQGYPLNIQIESSIYSWGEGDLQDVLILRYVLENKSTDTLFDCWFGKASDIDIGEQNDSSGIYPFSNDRIKYYDYDSTYNLVIGWTNTDRGELGMGFGYIGMSLLETPAVDAQGYIRNDKLIYEAEEMLGLTTFKKWNIEDDPKEDDSRYDFLSSDNLDNDIEPGDSRTLLSSGPFNLSPGDKAHFTVLIAFALPAKGGEADGTGEDISGLPGGITNKDNPDKQSSEMSLIEKIKGARDNYYNNLVMKILESEVQRDGLIIYPNPAKENISIELNNNIFQASAENVQVRIFDMLGIEVISESIQNLTTNHKMNIEHLPSGVYFIRIGDKIGKFVKE